MAEIVSVAIIYYLTGRLGRLMAPPPGMATVVWPPSGIALAALLILGNRIWPGVWLGAFLANNWGTFHLSDPRGTVAMLATGIGIDTGVLLQALAGAALIRRFVGDRNPFDRVKDTLTFIGISLPVCLIASSLGVLSLWLGGFLPTDYAVDRWSNWWIGDTGGVLVMAPVILTCWYQGWPRWSGPRRREAMFLFGTVILFAMAIFLFWHPVGRHKYPSDLLLLPLIAWVAVRFTQREVTVLVLVVLTIALAGTVNGRGPYASNDVWSMLPVLQAFIGILSMLSLSIGAAIAERKRTEEALQASEHWLKESQRISRVGSYVMDLQAGSWTQSETLDETFGIEAGSARSLETWAQLIHPDDRQAILDYFHNEVIARRQPFDREYRIVGARDGKVRWVHGIGKLYYDDAGRLAAMAGTIQDVTEQKHLEEQLRQAHKMESIGRLAGGVAHDFNNLLTVINGYSDLALHRMSPHDAIRSHVMAVRKAGERASALTQQLLAFSRRQVLQPRVIDLNSVVSESESILLRLIEENIQFVTVLSPSLGLVSADPTQMSQILLNLVVNARDAMPHGGLLRLETANVALAEGDIEEAGEIRSGAFVMLEVSDSGIGMDEETRRHVFEPFFTTKGPGKGTGLGLATVYGIVKQSGGLIRLESAPGMGTTIRIYLPRVASAKPQEAVPAPAPASWSSSGTVLLVEDQEHVRRYVALVLTGLGYRVLEADSGAAALDVAAAHQGPLDLLLTDVVMPGINGRALAEQMTAQYPAIRVLYMSGHSDDIADRHGVLQNGGSYLQKPFGAETLGEKVREVLSRGVKAASPAPPGPG